MVSCHEILPSLISSYNFSKLSMFEKGQGQKIPVELLKYPLRAREVCGVICMNFSYGSAFVLEELLFIECRKRSKVFDIIYHISKK